MMALMQTQLRDNPYHRDSYLNRQGKPNKEKKEIVFFYFTKQQKEHVIFL